MRFGIDKRSKGVLTSISVPVSDAQPVPRSRANLELIGVYQECVGMIPYQEIGSI